MPQAYLTRTPWVLFTSSERKRQTPLAHCPSKACQRAKACVDPFDKIYCKRSHESVKEARARKKITSAPVKRRSRNMTLDQATAMREEYDVLLAAAQAQERDMTLRWKAGEFDTLYGKFKPSGVWKQPPLRQYTE